MGRASGILLHVTSLPGEYGIGDLGPESRKFVDLLAEAKQKLWCVLPLGPTGSENSPYQSRSAFAGNPLLISPQLLVERGYLAQKELSPVPKFSRSQVEFSRVRRYKYELLRKAFSAFSETKDYSAFEAKSYWWLEGFAAYMALREANGGAPWIDFAKNTKCSPLAIRFHKFVQYEFFRQWRLLRKYCAERNVAIMGDMPFYVEHDSADVWSNPQLFDLAKDGHPRTVGGVPPDYFSRNGQLWGNPTYRWRTLEETGFAWWVDRLRVTLETVDLLRLDHFRGFESFWSVRAGQATARKGRWVKGPGAKLFNRVRRELGSVSLVAENLGTITPEVENLRRQFGFPGMAVLQFGFGEDGMHRPEHYVPELVSYTGTHDNNTTRGWWNALRRKPRAAEIASVKRVKSYVQTDGREIEWSFIQAIQTSVANTAVLPMQDLLGLGAEARMNMPGRAKGNWRWRFQRQQVKSAMVERLRDLTEVSGR
jgi:4-alpha-glucanotransferase